MNVEITYHSTAAADMKAQADDKMVVPVLPKQVGNVVTLTSTVSVTNGAAVEATYIARLLPSAACRVAWGANAVATANSMQITSETYVMLKSGERVSILAV